jgi:hypothetical protein
LKPGFSATVALGLVPTMLVIATGTVLGLFPGETFAESSVTLSVTARIVAPCTITSSNPQSSCSEQILAQQNNVRNASARISNFGNETVITHKGGLPPKIEKEGNQLLVSF